MAIKACILFPYILIEQSFLIVLAWQCTDMEYLDVSHNDISLLPSQLRRMENLLFLNLSFNPLGLANLRSLGALKALTQLDLSHTERSDV